jgi:hypothetical protein
MFKNIVRQNSDLLEERLSLYEKHNPALFVREEVLAGKDYSIPETAHLARGEIGHVHPDVSGTSATFTFGGLGSVSDVA